MAESGRTREMAKYIQQRRESEHSMWLFAGGIALLSSCKFMFLKWLLSAQLKTQLQESNSFLFHVSVLFVSINTSAILSTFFPTGNLRIADWTIFKLWYTNLN